MKCIRGDCVVPMAGWIERLPFCLAHLRLIASRLAEAKAGPSPPRRGLFRRRNERAGKLGGHDVQL
jgi:hypothetical protein